MGGGLANLKGIVSSFDTTELEQEETANVRCHVDSTDCQSGNDIYATTQICFVSFSQRYGGYLPRALTKHGLTYGNVSHLVLRTEPDVAARLAPLRPASKENQPDTLDCTCQTGYKICLFFITLLLV